MDGQTNRWREHATLNYLFYDGIQALEKRWTKSISVAENYVEK